MHSILTCCTQSDDHFLIWFWNPSPLHLAEARRPDDDGFRNAEKCLQGNVQWTLSTPRPSHCPLYHFSGDGTQWVNPTHEDAHHPQQSYQDARLSLFRLWVGTSPFHLHDSLDK